MASLLPEERAEALADGVDVLLDAGPRVHLQEAASDLHGDELGEREAEVAGAEREEAVVDAPVLLPLLEILGRLEDVDHPVERGAGDLEELQHVFDGHLAAKERLPEHLVPLRARMARHALSILLLGFSLLHPASVPTPVGEGSLREGGGIGGLRDPITLQDDRHHAPA